MAHNKVHDISCVLKDATDKSLSKKPRIEVSHFSHPNVPTLTEDPSNKGDNFLNPLGVLNPVFELEEASSPGKGSPEEQATVFDFDEAKINEFEKEKQDEAEKSDPQICVNSVSVLPRRGSYTPGSSLGDKTSLTVPSIHNIRRPSDPFSSQRDGRHPGNLQSLATVSIDSLSVTDRGYPPLSPGYLSIGGNDHFFPPPSPGLLSTNSAWSELAKIHSRRSSYGDFNENSSRATSRTWSVVSSSLSEHLHNLVRAFSSRTERVKEATIQPPTPSSISDFDGNSEVNSAYSGSVIDEPPQRERRIGSFIPGHSSNLPQEVDADKYYLDWGCCKSRAPKWCKHLKIPSTFEAQSKIYMSWLFLVTLTFMYNAWVIPLRGTFQYQNDANVKYWLVCDYVSDFIYVLDIVLIKPRLQYLESGLMVSSKTKLSQNLSHVLDARNQYRADSYHLRAREKRKNYFDTFGSGVLHFKGRQFIISEIDLILVGEKDVKLTRKNYTKKMMFKFDLLSLLPLDLFYLLVGVIPWLRLPRIFKIHTFWEFYERCDQAVRSAHVLRIIKTMTYMLYLVHIETCGYYFVSWYEGFGTNRWVYNGVGVAYIRCFYLATKTATSIGNNPKPTNTLEYMFMVLYWLSGVFVFALLIGQIRDIAEAAGRVKTLYNKRMDAALWYVKNLNLPKETQDRVRTWFLYNWEQTKILDEKALMDWLPKNLRTDLAIHVHFGTLSKVKLFSDCDKSLLYDLVLKLKPILYLPGDLVCRKGEVGKEMYIVSQGQVDVVGGPDNSIVLATLKEGSVFGEISLLAFAEEGNRRTADVVCKGFTNLFILSKIDFESAMIDYPEAHKLLRKRAKKLMQQNKKLLKDKSGSADESSKIETEEIFHSPKHGRHTPKMVRTVIQVLNPDTTVGKRLHSSHSNPKHIDSNDSDDSNDSGNNGKHSNDKDADDENNSQTGKEMEQEENGSTSSRKTECKNGDGTKAKKIKDVSKDLPKAEEVEKFYDEMLAIDRVSQHDIDPSTFTLKLLERKNTVHTQQSEDSIDSGVQMIKAQSPTESNEKTISNKDSKDSFISSEVADIFDDTRTWIVKQVTNRLGLNQDTLGDFFEDGFHNDNKSGKKDETNNKESGSNHKDEGKGDNLIKILHSKEDSGNCSESKNEIETNKQTDKKSEISGGDKVNVKDQNLEKPEKSTLKVEFHNNVKRPRKESEEITVLESDVKEGNNKNEANRQRLRQVSVASSISSECDRNNQTFLESFNAGDPFDNNDTKEDIQLNGIPHQNQITCSVEVHREKSLTPASLLEWLDNTTSNNVRRRKESSVSLPNDSSNFETSV